MFNMIFVTHLSCLTLEQKLTMIKTQNLEPAINLSAQAIIENQ